MVKLVLNPVVLHGAVVLFCASFAFVLGMVFMRLLRKSIQEEADISSGTPAFETLPLHVYNTVIRQLKEQQDELKAQSQAEQQRSRSTERFNEAVLSSTSCGVLRIGKNNLIKSANPAAKQILAFASPVGMNMSDLFRGAVIRPDSPSSEIEPNPPLLSEELDRVLKGDDGPSTVQAEYQTPTAVSRTLSITLVPLRASDASMNGAACLINDITELMRLRQQIGCEQARQTRVASAGV
jgi:nitrogen fixation/metabolism regulation signal transduction histidine kinase